MRYNRDDQVVPIRAWREARALKEMISAGDLYTGCLEGYGPAGREDAPYLGIVYTIGASCDLCEDETFLDEPVLDSYDDPGAFGGTESEGYRELIAIEDRMVEKYEFYDMATEDLHVMYRIPFRPLKHKPLKGNPKA